ncbi:hypothetical protein BaRGS_00005954 [Batillaria attramentaria]|uniref:Uncharacterized protein n=1 Tax=Batillaria attramentaria TaxID=370345 RepID=A0ABD0LUK7_9CAEN
MVSICFSVSFVDLLNKTELIEISSSHTEISSFKVLLSGVTTIPICCSPLGDTKRDSSGSCRGLKMLLVELRHRHSGLESAVVDDGSSGVRLSVSRQVPASKDRKPLGSAQRRMKPRSTDSISSRAGSGLAASVVLISIRVRPWYESVYAVCSLGWALMICRITVTP